MSSIHGKNAVIYLAPGTGAAVEVSEQNQYAIEMDFDLAGVPELGDTWESAVKGLMKWSGSLEGNFNTAGITLWSAAVSATPSNFYLYVDRTVAANYYYGTCWVKLGTILGGGTGDKAKSAVKLIGEGALSTH